MRIYWRGALRLPTKFFVTRHLSTSAEIALHWVESSRKMNWRSVENLSYETCWISTHLNWWMSFLQENTPMTWFGLMNDEVTGWGHDFVCVSSRPRGSEMICLREGRHVFHQVLVDQSCELQGFRITRCRHQCCIHARSNRWGNLWESAFRNPEFKILAAQGSSEWNEESIKALARVLMRHCTRNSAATIFWGVD